MVCSAQALSFPLLHASHACGRAAPCDSRWFAIEFCDLRVYQILAVSTDDNLKRKGLLEFQSHGLKV
jgi:hypothetical protein